MVEQKPGRQIFTGPNRALEDDVETAPGLEATSAAFDASPAAALVSGQELQELLTAQPLVQPQQLPRVPPGQRLATLLGRRHWLLLPLCIVLLAAATTLRPPGENSDLRPGQPAPRDIIASRSATLLDRELTRRNREAAADLLPPEYDARPTAADQSVAELRAGFAALVRSLPPAKSAKGKGGSVRAADLPNAGPGRPLSAALAALALRVHPARWGAVERAAEAAARAVYLSHNKVQRIRSDVDDDLLLAQGRMAQAVAARPASSPLTGAESGLALGMAAHFARLPNLVVNEEKTEHARRQAEQAVPEVFQSISAGRVLVEAGTRLDAERWAELQDLDIVASHVGVPTALAKLVLCALLACFAAAYLVRFHPRLIEQPASLSLAASVPVLAVVAFRFLLRVPHGDELMVPLVATAAMLLTVLLDTRVGLICAFVVGALCAVMARADSGLFLGAALAASIGVLAVAEIASRFQLVRAAMILAATNAALSVSLGLMHEMSVDELMSGAVWAALAGLVAVGLTAGLAMFLERPFGITTHLRLLELSAPDEVVMRRMQSEAPGTYTHSLMVSLLGETAAKSVGADPLLCRVGGLYHDIGKLRRPHCFVENQSGDNVHDRLAPQLSALLIIGHVKDGLELGRALRLPQPVSDIILQHHGSSLLSYFYSRAATLARELPEAPAAGDAVAAGALAATAIPLDESPYRYPGPRPQTKEAAIIMLADTIEASARALPNLTPAHLEEHIKSMLQQRLADGELSECDLTLRDLKTIEKSFAHVLRGVLHQRIEYPDPAGELATPSRNWTKAALADPRSGEPEPDAHARRFPFLPLSGEHRAQEGRSNERRNQERPRSPRDGKGDRAADRAPTGKPSAAAADSLLAVAAQAAVPAESNAPTVICGGVHCAAGGAKEGTAGQGRRNGSNGNAATPPANTIADSNELEQVRPQQLRGLVARGRGALAGKAERASAPSAATVPTNGASPAHEASAPGS